MMKIKLSKNSWHYALWTKCMKSEALYKMFGERVDWYDYEIARRIPQDLCTYMLVLNWQ